MDRTLEAGALLAGRYRADALLGRGGMGEVWRCRDTQLGGDVAVKVLRAGAGAAGDRLFLGEVTAIASLCHPNIVPIYDFHQPDDGPPLLVMEHRAGESLRVFAREPPSYQTVREILRQVLCGLAYAHARGVLHLDVKPDNVLVARRRDELGLDRFLVTIVDFGISRVRRIGRGIEPYFGAASASSGQLLGTLAYMAPEQCSESYEQLGPWTDLYALGAVLYQLCSGRKPYAHASGDAAGLILEKVTRPPPPLIPRIEGVPRRLPLLCASLLAVDPTERPGSAADVMRALGALDADDTLAPTSAVDWDPEGQPTVADAAPTQRGDDATEVVELWSRKRPPLGDEAEVPERPDRRSEPLAGAYALFGLRELAVVGRESERAAVWNAVATTATEGRPSLVILEGPAGSGKSRLARDAIERGRALGACHAMQTGYSPERTADQGLHGLVANEFETRGMSTEALASRVSFWLRRVAGDLRAGEGSEFVRDVQLLLAPDANAQPDPGLAQRTATETVRLAARRQPVAIWMDDVQWSAGEAADLVRALFAAALPVCVIATVRNHDTDPAAALLLLEAASTSAAGGLHVARVRLDALADQPARQLVRGLLDVDEDLCSLVVKRSEGNPLFITQLLRQLMVEDVLSLRDGRYSLAPGTDMAPLPADAGAVWARRVALSGAEIGPLALLASVRDRVSLDVARELARLVGASFDRALTRALAAGLLRAEGRTYQWTHGLLRDYLRSAPSPEERARHHQLAAAALAILVGREDIEEERSHHLRAAGLHHEAAEALFRAAEWSASRGEPHVRASRLEELLRWTNDPALLARTHADLAHTHGVSGRASEASAHIHEAWRAVALVAPALADATQAFVAFRESQCARRAGDLERGLRATHLALDLARKSSHHLVVEAALTQMAVDALRAGDLDATRRLGSEALARAEARGHHAHASAALRVLANATDAQQGLHLIERAIVAARAAGSVVTELEARASALDRYWAAARDRGRREARSLVHDASARGLRQLVVIAELAQAEWAILEGELDQAAERRDGAERFGASRGAVVERALLAAVDAALHASRGDRVGAAASLEALAAIPKGRRGVGAERMLAHALALLPGMGFDPTRGGEA